MKVKPILKILLVVFAFAYVAWSGNSAAQTLRHAWRVGYLGVMTLADSAGKFFDALLRH